MKDRALAMRYAQALFELAEEQKSAAKIEQELRVFFDGLAVQKEYLVFFENPLLAADEKQAVLTKLLGKQANPLTLQFLGLLVTSNRFDILETVLESYHELLNQSRHIQEIVITTAKPLKARLRELIEKMISKRIDQKVISETNVNPALLGGVRIQIRHRLFDGSIRTKLDDLRKQMIGVASH